MCSCTPQRKLGCKGTKKIRNEQISSVFTNLFLHFTNTLAISQKLAAIGSYAASGKKNRRKLAKKCPTHLLPRCERNQRNKWQHFYISSSRQWCVLRTQCIVHHYLPMSTTKTALSFVYLSYILRVCLVVVSRKREKSPFAYIGNMLYLCALFGISLFYSQVLWRLFLI